MRERAEKEESKKKLFSPVERQPLAELVPEDEGADREQRGAPAARGSRGEGDCRRCRLWSRLLLRGRRQRRSAVFPFGGYCCRRPIQSRSRHAEERGLLTLHLSLLSALGSLKEDQSLRLVSRSGPQAAFLRRESCLFLFLIVRSSSSFDGERSSKTVGHMGIAEKKKPFPFSLAPPSLSVALMVLNSRERYKVVVMVLSNWTKKVCGVERERTRHEEKQQRRRRPFSSTPSTTKLDLSTILPSVLFFCSLGSLAATTQRQSTRGRSDA